jgi:hypothetical protein
MGALEFLGPDHGHEQIQKQHQGNKADDNILHRSLLESVAEANVQRADDEEAADDGEIDDVGLSIHGGTLPPTGARG